MEKAAENTRRRKERRARIVKTMVGYLGEYRNCLIVNIDNVSSNQMQGVRLALRGKAVCLFGKNTLMRKIIRDNMAVNPKIEALLPLVKNNMGFVFTNDNLNEVRKVILANKVPAGARVGSVAPVEVVIPAGSTGLDPGQTSFFQTLSIATKLVKGAIEIINPVTILKAGDKVSSSHVALLDKLNIKPFQYGVAVTDVYEDGVVYSADILDMSQDDLMNKFLAGVGKVAAVSLALGYPTAASLRYHFAGAFQKLVALSLATEYTFEAAQKFKDILANPGAFAAAASTSASASSAAAPVVEEKPESESEVDMGFSLFD